MGLLTQVRDAGGHALAADVVPQALVVVLLGHQVLQPLERCFVLTAQELQHMRMRASVNHEHTYSICLPISHTCAHVNVNYVQMSTNGWEVM